ncbi:Hypothetical protein SRAE_2000478610 [Strongyloides ratti]|uniref:Caenorhabditis elegans ly-6-related family-containing protein n=1 Tax=Strongyloides ratti TaxID=34506 RepID=A0A090MFS9_STRRB|nr:Hypothetical protein SRAE_2000478610 [Strongyloides ratti]CEG06142.1 Hypothetical protein SRAE_2000478610 [Strongyloides ratti]
MILFFTIFLLFHQSISNNTNVKDNKLIIIFDLKKNLQISNFFRKTTLISDNKNVLEAFDPIKCYSYINKMNKIEKYFNLTDSPEADVNCYFNDICIKYTIQIDESDTAIWKGCFSKFQKDIGKIYGEYIINSCFMAESYNNETICFCNDNNFCNSNSKIFFFPTLFIPIILNIFFYQ